MTSPAPQRARCGGGSPTPPVDRPQVAGEAGPGAALWGTWAVRRTSLSGFLTTRTPTMDPSMMSSTIAPTTRPPSVNTAAGCPLRTVGCRDAPHLLGDVQEEPRAARRTDHGAHGSVHLAPSVGPDDHVVREHGQKPREVSRRARHEEAVHQGAALTQVRIEALAPFLDPLSCSRPELAARGCGPSQRARHLLKGIPEDVVKQIRRARSSGVSSSSSTRKASDKESACSAASSSSTITGSGNQGPAYVTRWTGPNRVGRGRAGSRW